MTPEILRALLTIGFGALAGGLTNTIAVWMLFHPYDPPRVGRLRLRFLHGAIPKNRDRLASAVGRAVGDRLLTQDDLTRILSDREFREAFDRRLEGFLQEILERKRGPIREILPPESIAEVEELLGGAADVLAERVDAWLASPAFEESAERRVAELLSRVSARPVGEVLTPDREGALAEWAEVWLTDAVGREGFARAIEDYMDRTAGAVLRDDRTFEDILPGGLVVAMEHALSSYLPLAVQRLGGILDDPDARARLETTVHDLFQRFLGDLRFHQRVVARLVVTEGTLAKVLDTIEEEGAEHLSEMLRDPTVQDAMARKVNDAVLDFLQRPVTSVLGRPGDESVERVRETVVRWVLGLTRDEETRAFVVEKIRQALGKAAEGTWGDLLGDLPPDRAARLVVSAARSEPVREAYREALRSVVVGALDRPIGRPADWLPAGSTRRLEGLLADPLWEWFQSQSPHVVKTLDVGRRVEEKIRDYPTWKMEELVRSVTQRELSLIVRLGYVLGAMIGAALVAVNALIV